VLLDAVVPLHGGCPRGRWSGDGGPQNAVAHTGVAALRADAIHAICDECSR
jgi:hypothetical protein